MISYTIYDAEFKMYLKEKDDADNFLRRWCINYELLKELLIFGEIVVDDKYKIYLNINNYKYRNLLKRALIKIEKNEENKTLIEEL